MSDGIDAVPAHLGDVQDERRRLQAMAYRMTGTLADAEDVVQETYLRWYRMSEDERAQIENPAAWLTRVGSRVALDLLGSARVRRERYVGEWLPEPVPADLFAGTAPLTDPAERVTLDESVSTALLVVLEAMTPAERVAFVLHDVFAMPFDEVAAIVGRSSAATRQLASTARRHVRAQRSVAVPRSAHDAAVQKFLAASRGGNLIELLEVLAPDVELRTDGGGVVNAARRPVLGPQNVARFILGVLVKQPDLRFDPVATPDGLAYRLFSEDMLYGVVNFRVVADRIADVWFVVNPDKLTSWMHEAV
ncbi:MULTISPECIES: RNA polymerase sigma factor SigJ [Gordonia]|uniref:RNA polymerase sigma factor SigJ n=2 Tax=Gordonia terrae TaxID=2055 RepID=A0AAD0KGH3_9ACTN|nr:MULTISPECIES: RNA polymerase sigma factor SigJ [Gordonia]VTR08515.1 RNA polymerase sigma factor SigJ [Clostridioides difficile]ANY25564.1 RNA polymerase subunit sigma-24 [Gordonia terrae]AWO86307.1 RNA polymerase sigma factor SigJ [Gordonia terrae]VTS63909.1 RNA polymerase sigma factor SigJ [Gordonia terrae]GAB44252.1 putative RNA polymerase ECF-type sigma factor [Gordonia terrae NBRC 100016]